MEIEFIWVRYMRIFELINGDDLAYVRRGDMDPDEVRRINVSALVDTGSVFMVINENIQDYLRLR